MMTAVAPTTPVDPAFAASLDDPRLAGAALAFVAEEQGPVLTGTVCNIWQYQALRAILMRSPVVVDVGIVAARRDDAEIAEAVRGALGLEGADVRARVRGGLVTLSGTANGIARAAIVARVGTLPGVVGIMDNTRA
ncbi:MAG: BON domain-containing protein [Chloroflexota bacterium]|nr:BON domain-containing protein [Chloroflexota bacterium]